MIDCALRLRTEYLNAPSYNPSSLKKGKYHGSNFNLEEKDRCVVATYIDFDYTKWIAEGLCEQEIITQCIDYLNMLVTPKKRKGKRLVKPYYKYGFLKNFQSFIYWEEKEKKYCISALLTTNDFANKHFWGEPPSNIVHYGRKKKKSRVVK